MEELMSCRVCGQSALARCSRCRAAYYCSVQCQGKDYANHRTTCYSILHNPLIGQEATTFTPQWDKVAEAAVRATFQLIAVRRQFNWAEPDARGPQTAASGTGFLITPDGLALTNFHVIAGGERLVARSSILGQTLIPVRPLVLFPDIDVALVRLAASADQLGQLGTLTLGDSSMARRTTQVMAVGFPRGDTGIKSTLGVINGRQDINGLEWLQMDAAVNFGNSGGPLIMRTGSAGAVVGINTLGDPNASLVGFAMPIERVFALLPRRIESSGAFVSALRSLRMFYPEAVGDIQPKILYHMMLGGRVQPTTSALRSLLDYPSDVTGVRVSDVFDFDVKRYKTGFNVAGVRSGDLITSINDLGVDNNGFVSVPSRQSKIPLINVFNSLREQGTVIRMGVASPGGDVRTVQVPYATLAVPYPIRSGYPQFEPVAFVRLAGVYIQQLRTQHIARFISDPRAHAMRSLLNLRNATKPMLAISSILPSSPEQNNRILRPGQLIKTMNGTEVRTLQDVLRQLRAVDDWQVVIQTTDNAITVLPVRTETVRLAVIGSAWISRDAALRALS